MEPGRDPLGDLDVIERELERYGGLEDRPRLVALNKMDVPDGRDMADLVRDDISARGWPVIPVSAASHEGLRELTFKMAEIVAARRAATPKTQSTRIVIRPHSVRGGAEFTIKPVQVEGGAAGWRVRGEKPERWIRQTDFSNDEAVGFLSDRLNRLGVEEKLLAMGAAEGDPVLIGDPDDAVVFDFRPGIDAGAQMLGRRGEDQRFEESRPAAQRRRDIDEAMDERAEGEVRADVARRLGHPESRPGDQPEDESPQLVEDLPGDEH
jgi:GTP-binding protein